ncbi:MAG: class I adenylate-forming enzyme family protein [Gemmatimonadota bacterium]
MRKGSDPLDIVRNTGPGGVAGILSRRAEETPDAVFLIDRDRSWSYAEVASHARALACAFRGLGVESGDRIAIDLPNCPEFVIAALSAAAIGATVVPLNPDSSPRELQFVLRNTEAVAVVTVERHGEVDYLELFESLIPDLPGLQYLVTVGEEDLWYDDRIFQFEDLVSSGRGQSFTPTDVDPGSPYAILYTAGTSAKQKGVVLTHASLADTARATAAAIGLGEADLTLCSVPLFNIFGLGAALLTTLVSASALVLQERFDADGALDLIERHGVTVLHGVPTMFVLIQRAQQARPRDLSRLRTGIIAGAPVSEDLIVALRSGLVPDLEIAYGLTETSPTVTITRPSDPVVARTQTVGRALDGVEVRVVAEDGSPLPVESVGEIVVRGFNVMQGYFRQPAATEAAFAEDGFLRTGDLGMIDAEGYLHIVGRMSDMIIRGGYNVVPREVEDHLRSLPAVHEVVVVGVPDDVLGERVCACVVPVEGAIVTGEEIRESCRSALAEYKVPDAVLFLDELPVTPGGKIHRAEVSRRLRESASARGGGDGDRRERT